MNTLTKPVARILYGLPYIVFGFMHFANGSAMVGMVPIPGGIFWVYLTGLALIAAAVSFTFNKYVYWAGLGLAVFLALTALTVHLPAVIGGNMNNLTTGLLKDIMLAGAALYFAGAAQRNEL